LFLKKSQLHCHIGIYSKNIEKISTASVMTQDNIVMNDELKKNFFMKDVESLEKIDNK